jgi:hypothetical protein
MKKFLYLAILPLLLFAAGCATNKLPSEDIEVFEKHADILKVLRSPKILPNSKEKYEAAKQLIKNVDLHYTRETATINKLFYYRDASVDAPGSDNPVFTFTYQHGNDLLRIRFFTFRMFVTRVEITEK